MAHNIPELLRKMMERLPGNQTQLAERLSTKKLKVVQPQVSRWLKGQEPERHNYDRIVEVAEKLQVITDVRSEDVASKLPSNKAPTVKLKGYVGAGSATHFYAYADEDFEEVEAPYGASNQTIALVIVGKSWGKKMDGWLVYYDDVRSPVTEDMYNQACVVGLADDRILLKTIKRERDGTFTLESNSSDEPDIKNAEIEWAAKVIGMRPR